MLTIRPFTPQDQSAAKTLILEGLAEHWGGLDSSLNPDLDDIAVSYAAAVFLVACQKDELVGTGALISEGAGVGRIVRMSVAKSERRQGVGRALLQALIQQAQQRNYNLIVLETTVSWEDAKAFYIRNGFTSTHEADGDVHFVREIGD
ncbi:MAG: GNAT family N-acetyltransferase [Chloroflexi bacterium]|nr:GNAT family N-acetyltransferase [Chloroflexota bacterium]